ncbi:MAG: hypothetical protein HYY08_00385 [Firmicutes bacterium]|nr:hypothetical protein [Bacillota bacterium]
MGKHGTCLVAACVMVLLVSGVVSSSEKSVPPRDVIERMIRAMEELPGSYVETLVRIFPGRVETSVQRVWSKPPLFRRVELAAPGGEGRTVVVENRGVIWVRVPGFDRVLMWKPAPGEEPVFPSGLGSEGLTQGHPPARGEASGVSGGLEGLQLPPGSMLQQLVGALGGRLSSAARVSSGELSGRPE